MDKAVSSSPTFPVINDNNTERTRKDLWIAALLGAIQTLTTGLWARQLAPELQWVGGAIIEFVLTGYFAFCLLQCQYRLKVALPLVACALLLPPIAGMAKYHYLLAAAGFGDLFELPDLMRHYGIYGWGGGALLGAVACGLCVLYLRNLRRPPRGVFVLWIFPLGFWALVAAKLVLPATISMQLPGMPPLRPDHAIYPSPVLFGNWGAFLRSTLIYADRQATIARLRQSATPDFGFLAGTLENPDQRNVYVIVLESFMDPTTIAGATYSKDPFGPLFQQWRSASGLTAMSPVFGARSAEAEFEAYCGLPVTFEGAPVIFPQLRPAEIDCLPRKLAKLGWQTETHTITHPSMYNYNASYAKLGFQQRFFLDSIETDDLDAQDVPSAPAVFSAHLRQVDRLRAGGKPFFTAVFGTFNHFPYPLNPDRRPPVIVTNSSSADFNAYVNSVYYTSIAAEDYIRQILSRDSDALIVAFGDHHPLLRDVALPVDYPGNRLTRQDTPLLVIDGASGFLPIQGRVPMFSLPEIISNTLTRGAYCQRNRCSHTADSIGRPLADALLASDRATNRTVNCFVAASAADPLCQGAADRAAAYQAALATLLGNE